MEPVSVRLKHAGLDAADISCLSAMMRQDGQYEGGNLNADLTQNILPAIQKDWFDAVNTKIPLDLGEFKDDIQTLLNETVKSICEYSPPRNLVVLCNISQPRNHRSTTKALSARR
jgi:hypothetical protein